LSRLENKRSPAVFKALKCALTARSYSRFSAREALRIQMQP